MKSSLSFKGDREIGAALAGLAPEIRERAIPKALRRGGQPLVKIAREKAPTDRTADPAGTLKKSIGLELRRPKRGPAYVAFGPRRGFARLVTRPIIVHGEIKGGVTRKADPANYGHLVENGHLVVVPKAGASIRGGTAVLSSGKAFVSPQPYLRPAMVAGRFLARTEIVESLARDQAAYINRKAKAAGRALGSALV